MLTYAPDYETVVCTRVVYLVCPGQLGPLSRKVSPSCVRLLRRADAETQGDQPYQIQDLLREPTKKLGNAEAWVVQ